MLRGDRSGKIEDPSALGTLHLTRSDSEERRREQSIEENRELDRLRDAAAHRITRNNPITRTQEQRTNTVHHRNTRLQRRFRE